VIHPQALKAVKSLRDPGYSALRRAARAAIVIPLAFAFAQFLLGEPQSLIFVLFGCFALLVMSDFGGLRRPRALAYLTATIVGAVLVALGTLASSSAWLAVLVMFIVGFVLSFSRVFGGYVAAANTGMLLAFVIAVTIPAPADAIPARVGGWAIAGLVATAAAVALWPRFERVTMHLQAAKALRAIADLIEGMNSAAAVGVIPRLKDVARQAEQAARQGYAAMAKRPAATAGRDRAFVQLLTELDRINQVTDRPFNEDRPPVRPGLPESDKLVASVAASLRSSAEVLQGGARPDVGAIDVARNQHRVALDRWADEQLRAGRPIEQVLDGLDFDHTFRVISWVAASVGANAIEAAGKEIHVGETARHVLRTFRTHLEAPSTVLQGSLRVAVGLALAVWVARAFDLSHAFWVVLGTIQVLRTNALGTGRTVVQAVVGNVIGVVIGGLFAVIAGNHPTLMWIAFPVAVFGAAYAATTIGFMLSQAAFTINLIIVFNLISPAGWQVGLVRIEDLLVGASISLLVGLLLWPQGARREFARALASLFRGLVGYLEPAFDRVLGFDSSDAEAARRIVVRAMDRADEAFDTFLNERGRGSGDQNAAAFLLSSANQAILGGDLLEMIAGVMGYRATACADGARDVREQVRILLGEYRRLADGLSLAQTTASESRVSTAALRQASLNCMSRWQSNAEVGKGALAVVMASEWVQNLALLEADLQQPVGAAVEAAQKPWWR
jgi:uncharacterized membrane protein YccC